MSTINKPDEKSGSNEDREYRPEQAGGVKVSPGVRENIEALLAMSASGAFSGSPRCIDLKDK